MDTTELIKKVRKIEIRTRGLSKQLFSGEYHSAFKGRGMAFSEVREYQFGDDIRTIDWNVTARTNHPYIKVFEEERELTVMLLVDLSASETYGAFNQTKRELITELCAVLAFSAIQNNDKIGIIFFTDKIEKFIPPKKGKTHALMIIRELIEFQPESKSTNVAQALEYMLKIIKKRSIVFILSDFLDVNFDSQLKIMSKKHDTIAVQTRDPRESELPNLGLIKMLDLESGIKTWVDTSNNKVRKNYQNWWQNNQRQINLLFSRNNVDSINLYTPDSYIIPLKNFFNKRTNKR